MTTNFSQLEPGSLPIARSVKWLQKLKNLIFLEKSVVLSTPSSSFSQYTSCFVIQRALSITMATAVQQLLKQRRNALEKGFDMLLALSNDIPPFLKYHEVSCIIFKAHQMIQDIIKLVHSTSRRIGACFQQTTTSIPKVTGKLHIMA